MTYLYTYRLSSDTGLAPCVEDGLLSLACCKGGQLRKGKPVRTGLRFWIGSMRGGVDYRHDTVYVLGTYKNKFLYPVLHTAAAARSAVRRFDEAGAH